MTEQIQNFGANARARGESFLDNPYLKPAACPAATGETIQEWTVKHDAWHLGWTVEDAIRS